MYAIIETGGKQYRVTAGDVVQLEKLNGDVGQVITFDKVLLIGGTPNKQVYVGAPYLERASLQGEIVDHGRGDKIRIIKYRRRKGYRRTLGHRQSLTRILVTRIETGAGQGEAHALVFDSAKRADALKKASVRFSERKAKRAATDTTAAKSKLKKKEK